MSLIYSENIGVYIKFKPEPFYTARHQDPQIPDRPGLFGDIKGTHDLIALRIISMLFAGKA
jgi:hypothetical protein